jgi:O-antigen ligase
LFLKKNIAYIIFQIIWIYLVITNIAELRLHTAIDLIPAIHVSEIPFIRYFPFIIILLLLFPIKDIINTFKNKFNVRIIVFILTLILAALIASFLSEYRNTAVSLSARFIFYFGVMCVVLIGTNYFEHSVNFIIKVFVYINLIVFLGSLLDFYSIDFHNLLKMHFDRPDALHSYMKIGGEKIMRPMGFLTDANLTAFSVAMALMMVLLNYKNFNKYFRYFYYAFGSFIFGMLVSRASLIICVLSIVFYFYKRTVEKKEIYAFIALFAVFQLLTPQTYSRLLSYFNKEMIDEEMVVGRPVIWKAAYNVFSENKIIGVGPGVFFELSQKYIRDILKENKDLNIDNPSLPDYHKIDKLNPHNIFLVMLSETGIIGFAVLLGFIIFLFSYFIKQKYLLSALFLTNILIVSALSNFAPYYKFYLVMCIIFIIASKQNMKLKPDHS